jgi:pimeloyl-ACP methyl ester carboxylesterase
MKIRLLLSALLAIATPAAALAHDAAPGNSPLAADARFTVVTEGSGPDVILIPGLASPRAVWDGTRTALAGKARLHVLQIRGFDGGDPGPNLSGPIIDTAVEQIAAYIKANKLQHVAVIGHSMGGLMALLIAKRHPEAVAKIMVVDALPYVGVIFAPGATVPQMEPAASAIRAQMTANYGKPANPAASRANAQRFALKPASIEQVMAWSDKADSRVVGQAFYEDLTTDLRGEMDKITTPITLLYPYSSAVPQANADQFYHAAYASAPHVTYVSVGDSAHFIMLDQPTAFYAAVTAFIEGK